LKIESVKVDQLKPYENNPKEHPPEQIDRIAMSIQEYGFTVPVVVDGDNEIIMGHGRIMAAKQLGLKEVPCIQRGDLTEGQIRGLRIADNKVAESGWDVDALSAELDFLDDMDFDLELTGFDLDEIEDYILPEQSEEQDAEPQMSRAEELNEEWGVKSGDLWLIGEHRLLCGDCTDKAVVERVMGGEKASMMFTDPPWNVAIGKDSNPRHRQRDGLENDDMTSEEYSTFVSTFVSTFAENVDGDVYCVLGASEWPRLDLHMRERGFHWSATIIWVKDIFVLGRSKYHRRYEPIWYGWHSTCKSSFNGARDLDDVWEMKRPKRSEEHPTMKPIELVEMAITNSSVIDDTIFDPFLGSGTTMVAAENLGRICYGMEISPDYCAVVLQRMQDAFPKINIEKSQT
jgi:DNA modification methylase